jgi:hypothetical protein
MYYCCHFTVTLLINTCMMFDDNKKNAKLEYILRIIYRALHRSP